jgi:hypothetical protein
VARSDDARRRNIIGLGAGLVVMFLVVSRLSNAEDGGQGWALIGIGAIVMIVGAMWGRPQRRR